jgi:hypothetical protein
LYFIKYDFIEYEILFLIRRMQGAKEGDSINVSHGNWKFKRSELDVEGGVDVANMVTSGREGSVCVSIACKLADKLEWYINELEI